MLETPQEVAALQRLLDDSAAAGGAHLSGIITADRRLTAAQLCDRLTGMRLLTVATVTADGRPLTGAVDGYFLHGTWYLSTSPDAVRMRHLRARPAISATHLPGESLQVTVHGRAELFELSDPVHGEMLKQAMLDHYLPIQGPSFEAWINDNQDEGAAGARIIADKMFTFHMTEST
ncbi:MAG TPA: pyridoxamine 5'-phosphate oxidase family protein [Mycobacteriales bacterium]|nr:pyridoxamine 5'-phosphate oxidase family protein [Mycobacteriales bacterium]